MTPEQRAKAVAERFAAELPSRSVPELERIVTSAINRALAQQLAELEAWAESSSEYAHGRGKSGKGQDWGLCAFMTNGPAGSGGWETERRTRQRQNKDGPACSSSD